MIHRPNYDDVQSFLSYHRETLQHDEKTVSRYWISLRVLLQWAYSTPFPDCKSVRPTFPSYVIAKPSDHNGEPCAPSHMDRILKDSRAFFVWARREYPNRYRVSQSWIDSLRLSRKFSEQADVKKIVAWSLDDVLKIAALPVAALSQRRDRAAIVFLYLSGMRIGAFTSLPISCVDIEGRRIAQLPKLGVKTKNRKAAITTLLPIPELLAVVVDWDSYVRTQLPDSCVWYPRIDHQRTRLTEDNTDSLPARRNTLSSGMRSLCKMAGIDYKSPHKLRHGHALYGIKHAQTIEAFKAVSQNLMHSTISITDGIYGNLASEDIQSAIARLNDVASSQPSNNSPNQVQGNNSPNQVQAILQAMQDDPEVKKQLLTALLSQLIS